MDDDADGQACSTASAMAEPSAVVAEARAQIDARVRELPLASPYRAEIERWLRDEWPPGAEVVPRLPADVAKKAGGAHATSIHDSVKSEMKSCRADLLKIREAARKRGAKEVARSADRSANRPRSGHNVAAARAVSSGIPASGRRFSGPGNPECDCGESESCGCYCRNCADSCDALWCAQATSLPSYLPTSYLLPPCTSYLLPPTSYLLLHTSHLLPSTSYLPPLPLAAAQPLTAPSAPSRPCAFRQTQYLAAKASNTESLLISNDDLPAYVDQHVRVSTHDKERLLRGWRDVMEAPLAACAACGVRAPPDLPCGSVLRADDTDGSASDEDEEAQSQTLDFEVVRERGRLGFRYRSDNAITHVTNSTSGLVEGDVVVAVDGINVTAAQSAHALIDDRPLQDRYRIRVERGRRLRPSPEDAAVQPVPQYQRFALSELDILRMDDEAMARMPRIVRKGSPGLSRSSIFAP